MYIILHHHHHHLYLHYLGTRKKRRIQRKFRRQNNILYNYTCTFFKSVCNSQSSKAFELDAAYLKIKEGTKNKMQ